MRVNAIRILAAAGTLLLAFPPFVSADTNIADTAELSQWVYGLRRTDAAFSLTNVTVVAVNFNQAMFAVRDGSHAMILHGAQGAAGRQVSAGDIIDVSGLVRKGGQYTPFVAAYATNVTVSAHRAPVAPLDVTAENFLSGAHDCHLVRLSGRVRDIVPDEIDRAYEFLILISDNQTIYVPCNRAFISLPDANRILGAEITVTGICDPSDIGGRRHVGRLLNPTAGDALRIDEPPPDPFDVPTLEAVGNISPAWVSALGPRLVTGQVIAILRGRKLILRTRPLAIVNIALAEEASAPVGKTSMPAVGDMIDAVGFPITDLYRLNLARSRWRPAEPSKRPPSLPASRIRTTNIDELVDRKGKDLRYNPFAHGWTVRLSGRVGDLPRKSDTVFPLHCDGLVIPVDATADRRSLADLVEGSVIEVTGICVMDSENWQTNVLFPQIHGFRLAVANPADIRLIARPPWWTPLRLFVLVGALLVLLVLILIWNLSLRILAERRGRALFKSQIAKVESELRIAERTRLAVELHDSISQNLAAISYEIAAENLTTADKMLRSCRTELRRCIWDLRNDALDEKDFSSAIRQTLTPVIGNAALFVRFNVSRAHLNDITAHAILSILRELAHNAVHHGQAKNIRIAGEHKPTEIRFSLRDDGCGFDSRSCPGPAEGHFGLNGIRDRVGHLGGVFTIESTPGKGTRAFVSIKSHLTGDEEP